MTECERGCLLTWSSLENQVLKALLPKRDGWSTGGVSLIHWSRVAKRSSSFSTVCHSKSTAAAVTSFFYFRFYRKSLHIMCTFWSFCATVYYCSLQKASSNKRANLRNFVFTGELLSLHTFIQSQNEAHVVGVRLQHRNHFNPKQIHFF